MNKKLSPTGIKDRKKSTGNIRHFKQRKTQIVTSRLQIIQEDRRDITGRSDTGIVLITADKRWCVTVIQFR